VILYWLSDGKRDKLCVVCDQTTIKRQENWRKWKEREREKKTWFDLLAVVLVGWCQVGYGRKGWNWYTSIIFFLTVLFFIFKTKYWTRGI